MIDTSCCVCGHAMEEREVGLEFVRFTDSRMPLYRKLYAYFCPACNSFRQVENKGIE